MKVVDISIFMQNIKKNKSSWFCSNYKNSWIYSVKVVDLPILYKKCENHVKVADFCTCI